MRATGGEPELERARGETHASDRSGSSPPRERIGERHARLVRRGNPEEVVADRPWGRAGRVGDRLDQRTAGSERTCDLVERTGQAADQPSSAAATRRHQGDRGRDDERAGEEGGSARSRDDEQRAAADDQRDQPHRPHRVDVECHAAIERPSPDVAGRSEMWSAGAHDPYMLDRHTLEP